MTDTYRISKIVAQLEMLSRTYDINLHDVSDIRELAYREGYSELYHIVSEHPTKYFYEILNRYE